MDKLGFTFYPKDWWTSESYFELTPIQRYYYLECLFIMYLNEGYLKTQKTQFENRIRTEIKTEDWEIVISKFEKTEFGLTHISVNKRFRKTLSNRENGKLGGRPPKPKKPNSETQNNPPLERERERERERELLGKNIFNNKLVKENFDLFLKNQRIPKNEDQIKLLIKKLESFPNDECRIKSLMNSAISGNPDIYEVKTESKNEKPPSIWIDGREHLPSKHKDVWVYNTIIATEVNRGDFTALLSDGTTQPLGKQQKSFFEANSLDLQFIKKGLIQ